MPRTRRILIRRVPVGGAGQLCLIAGPCVIEEEETTASIAGTLKAVCSRLGIGLIFKASFDKANRSSVRSFRGTGFRRGLDVLRSIRRCLDIPVTTDIHCIAQVADTAEAVDLLQIPAFLCRQTDLLLEAARTRKPVNVKKGQFLSPWDVRNIIEKIESAGNRRIILTERGVCFGYNTLVSDFRALPIIRSLGYPVVFDATHSVQQPGGLGNRSGGRREFVPCLARAAVAVGCDGIFLEVHPDPNRALSDGPNMIELGRVESLLKTLIAIRKTVHHVQRQEIFPDTR